MARNGLIQQTAEDVLAEVRVRAANVLEVSLGEEVEDEPVVPLVEDLASDASRWLGNEDHSEVELPPFLDPRDVYSLRRHGPLVAYCLSPHSQAHFRSQPLRVHKRRSAIDPDHRGGRRLRMARIRTAVCPSEPSSGIRSNSARSVRPAPPCHAATGVE